MSDAAHAKHRVPIIVLSWGDSHVARYIGWNGDDLVLEGTTYTAAPEMRVECDELHGGVRPTPFKVDLFADRAPLNTLIRPYPHAPVTATIYEVDPTTATLAEDLGDVVYQGTVTRSWRNPGGTRRIGRIEIMSWKARMTKELGVIVDSLCSNIFGDPNTCGKNIEGLKETKVLTVSGNLITTDTPLTDAGTGKWRFGSIRFDGLSMMIMDDTISGLLLRRAPPPEWDGASAIITPGCSKELGDRDEPEVGTCRYWNNERRFLGLGVKLQDRNPLLDRT